MTLKSLKEKGLKENRLFTQAPARLLLNENINSYDRDVYSVIYLCAFIGNGSAWATQQEIARFIRISERQVRESVRRLHEAGEIEIKRKGRRSNTYAIATPAEKLMAAPAALSCSHCKRPRKGLGLTGWCKSCVKEMNLEKRIGEARAALGSDSDEEQIAQYLHLKKITAPVRKVMRRMELAA